ncbi:carboxypeptidase-like regulatory domain-containing protein [Hymenobacter coalescens]
MRLISILACTAQLLTSCAATRPELLPGTYIETRPNAVLFSSKELRLYPGHRFRYFQHEDVLAMARTGAGTYRLRGQQLELRFDGLPDTAASRASAQPVPFVTDKPEVQVLVTTLEETGQQAAVGGVTVLLRDAAGQIIGGTSTGADGYAALPLAQATAPGTLEVTGIGFATWRQAWPAQAVRYHVALALQPYQPYAAGTRKSFKILSQAPGRLVLQARDTITLAAQPELK